MLAAELRSVLAVRPELTVVKVADGAKDNWTYLHQELPGGVEAVDFFHAVQHLKTAFDAAYGEHNTKARSQFEKYRHVLRDDDQGVEKVIRALVYLLRCHPRRKAIATELAYFRAHRHRMRYAEMKAKHLPIGSGVVEAACKTLVTQRMKRSGMRWRHNGGQAILTLRSLIQSERFDAGWRLLTETFRAEVKPPENVVAFPRDAAIDRSVRDPHPHLCHHAGHGLRIPGGVLRGLRSSDQPAPGERPLMEDLDVLYRARFPEPDRKAKEAVWRVLCRHFFQRFVRNTDAVLELGCGYGEFIRFIEAGRKIAIDANPDSAAYLTPDVEFNLGDATDLGFVPSDTIDVCFVSNFFEHLPSKRTLDELLLEVRRVLRPGGSLVAMQSNIKYAPGDYWDSTITTFRFPTARAPRPSSSPASAWRSSSAASCRSRRAPCCR